jgi:hypothetical protein
MLRGKRVGGLYGPITHSSGVPIMIDRAQMRAAGVRTCLTSATNARTRYSHTSMRARMYCAAIVWSAGIHCIRFEHVCSSCSPPFPLAHRPHTPRTLSGMRPHSSSRYSSYSRYRVKSTMCCQRVITSRIQSPNGRRIRPIIIW